MAIAWSGRPSTLYGSTSRSQSIRLTESHCLSLPFWYRASIRSRPSPYSQLNRADPASGTVHRSSGTGPAYSSWVDMGRSPLTARDAHRTSMHGVRTAVPGVGGEHHGAAGPGRPETRGGRPTRGDPRGVLERTGPGRSGTSRTG